jgi:hypothetical protein
LPNSSDSRIFAKVCAVEHLGFGSIPRIAAEATATQQFHASLFLLESGSSAEELQILLHHRISYLYYLQLVVMLPPNIQVGAEQKGSDKLGSIVLAIRPYYRMLRLKLDALLSL